MIPSEGSEYFDSSEFALRASIEDEHYWHLHRRAVLLEALRDFGAPHEVGSLIELGCGIGTVATYLNENGYSVDYGDYFENAIGIARQRAQKRLGRAADDRRFLQIDVTQPLPLEGYRGVLMFDVIEHLPDDLGVLRHVHRMLDDSKDSFVMVTVPAFQFLWSPWDDVEKHKRRYTQAQLTGVLDQAGFEVVRSTYFFAPLFFAALGVKMLRTLRAAVAPVKTAEHIGELVEAKTSDLLNKIVLGAHRPERQWLSSRVTARLPLGTSILAIARRR